jgi:hypothetical protein
VTSYGGILCLIANYEAISDPAMPGVNSRLQARVPGSQHRQHIGD